ncbi:hypothetical protein OHC33_010075 [Knufia fluminis]|uniref:Uncharacterized protein n=1 Tax=Knufia fluminis TaxID=191047 RepID=A0AAN8E8C9_9EURO|nr:hypothetical protein OHC33_010075 [Knufia fluminis]
MSNSSQLTSGWQGGSNQRGTADIIWSCFSTIFLCLWSMLHLNLPAPTDEYWTIFRRKARWLLLGVLAPEVPMLMACGQWSSAKRSVKEMQELGLTTEQWSMSHAFFADSGGIILKWDNEEVFPITAKQVAWLVRGGHIDVPNIPLKELRDKSKADMCTKALASIQTGWLLVQIVARAAQHLPVTPMELTSAALAMTSLTTLWFWRDKPLDAQAPYLVDVRSKPGTSHQAAGSQDCDKQQTTIVEVEDQSVRTGSSAVSLPLDHVEPGIYISRKWSRRVFRWICQVGLQKPKLDRIPNDRDPQLLGFKQHATLGVATAAFATIHFVDWHFHFATLTEQWIWRANCILMCGLLAVYGTAEVVICCRENYSKLGLDTAGGYKLRFPAGLWFFIPGSMYFMARLLLIGAVFAGMRALPRGAFQEVQWTTFLPHI